MKLAVHHLTKNAEPWDDNIHFSPEWSEKVTTAILPTPPWLENENGEIITNLPFLRERMALTQATFRLRLIALGIMPSAIDGMINQIADPVEREKARTAWEYATEIHRLHPLVITLAAALNKTPEQIDAIFAPA